MQWRYPDRPMRIFSLRMVKDGEWMSQTKYDGHFAVIIKEGKFSVMSRHKNKLPISPAMLGSIEKLDIPDCTVLHGEWTSRRQSNKEEALYLFSAAYWNSEWLGPKGEEDRYKLVQSITLVDNIYIVENRCSGYAKHYKSTINDWKTEGIVLKRRNGKMIGSMSNESMDNSALLKLKWRSGQGGDSIEIVPDDNLKCAP